MLPIIMSYNSQSPQVMNEDCIDPDDVMDADSSSEFEFDPSELLQSPLFEDSDNEPLDPIASSSELNFDYEQEVEEVPPSAQSFQQQDHRLYEPDPIPDDNQVFLDSDGFPIKKKKRRPPIPEDQRPRRIPGLVKDSRSRRLQDLQSNTDYTDMNAAMYLNSQGVMNMNDAAVHLDDNSGNFLMNTMDMNVNTTPMHAGSLDMDVAMSPEPNTSPSMFEAGSNIQVPGDLHTYNEAMEKLCESMQRSAMSRNLVKQLSGQSLSKSNSNRSLGSRSHGSRTLSTRSPGSRQSSGRSLNPASRQSSGRSLLVAQTSAHSLVKQNSGQRLVKQTSSRSVDDTDLMTPSMFAARRHRMTRETSAPTERFIYRHKSASAVTHNQQNEHNTISQLDDSDLGLVFDGKNMYSL